MIAAVRPWLVRGSILLAILLAEFLFTTIAFDTKDLLKKPGILTGLIERWAPSILQAGVVFILAAVGLLYLRSTTAVVAILKTNQDNRFRPSFLVAHLLLFGISFLAATQFFAAQPRIEVSPDVLGAACIVFGLTGLIFALLAFVPGAMMVELLRCGGGNWFYAAGAAVLTEWVAISIQRLWEPAIVVTFAIVQKILLLLPIKVISEPATATIGTDRFAVIVGRQCSGLEGAGLFLVFGLIGLIVFRSDFRFPRALLLIPLGIVTLYLFNAARIILLILIGHAGAREIALGGFHSQAGWISFNIVSLGLFAWARRSSFFAVDLAGASNASTDVGPVVPEKSDVGPYLLPFLSILAIGMLVRASSGSFEWLYPLKVIAAALVIWHYRDFYHSRMDWRFGWLGIGAGVAVFLLWIGLDFLTPAKEIGMPTALAAASGPMRVFWIISRVIGATLTVPIAEELAFRAFLIRRFISPDLEACDPKQFTWFGLFASSLIFGGLHGERWIAGTFAGLIYSFAMLRSGRIGDPIAAHAITNGLLALVVLIFGTWRYW